ncbi:hypothetical protein TTHERM_00627060 (macronuclear) [Tetrahymena thermophila SB210]|uniref:Uncharacterized protein n=1 Tax=Tetrahymena thermophila (strain SB210) TaxID=312017 RepID=Q23RZ3_TETTS|nr:hypothetical protein TTHERM_00627060 [Tetrahymena thermophila SB210]EAR99246.2 hypothetical protein TTHERM_00627060 [Tetrahymena thermophila SB210]|eukprot:XP_001019491.2 hypothetical protein TTHERM_00627060 [Tetrahymena thermophila SB210]
MKKQEITFSHEQYIHYLNLKIQESKEDLLSSPCKDQIFQLGLLFQQSYVQNLIIIDEARSLNYLQNNSDDIYQTEGENLSQFVEHRKKMENGLISLPENAPIDFVESGIVMSQERPFNYLSEEEYQLNIPTNLGQNMQSQYKRQLDKHISQLKKRQQYENNVKKDYLKSPKQQLKDEDPLFQISYQSLIANRSIKQSDEIVDQKYLIANFFKVNESFNELQKLIQQKEENVRNSLMQPQGDIPFDIQLSKSQTEQNRCSFLLGQLLSLEQNKIHSPYFERVQFKIKLIYQLMDKLQQIQQFYLEVFEIFNFLQQNVKQISIPLIQDATEQFHRFIQKQKTCFLTQKENDNSNYQMQTKKQPHLSERLRQELINIFREKKSLEKIRNDIRENFINKKEIQKLFSYQQYFLAITQIQDQIQQKIQQKGKLLHITQILYKEIIDQASLITFRYFSEYEDEEIQNSYIFAEEIYKLKKQLKIYIQRNLEFNDDQMLNLTYYYQQLVQQRRNTQNQLLRKVYRKFLQTRKEYLKKVGKYNKNE